MDRDPWKLNYHSSPYSPNCYNFVWWMRWKAIVEPHFTMISSFNSWILRKLWVRMIQSVILWCDCTFTPFWYQFWYILNFLNGFWGCLRQVKRWFWEGAWNHLFTVCINLIKGIWNRAAPLILPRFSSKSKSQRSCALTRPIFFPLRYSTRYFFLV